MTNPKEIKEEIERAKKQDEFNKKYDPIKLKKEIEEMRKSLTKC